MKQLPKLQKTIFVISAICSCLALLLSFSSVRAVIILFAEQHIAHRELSRNYWHHFLFVRGLFIANVFFFVDLIILSWGNWKAILTDKYPLVFSVCIIYFFLLSNLFILNGDGFYGYANRWDFGDFALVIEDYATADLTSTNYPPLAVAFFKFLYLFLPQDGGSTEFAINYLMHLFLTGTALAVFVLCFSLLKGTTGQRLFYSAVIFLTGPMLFTYQRLNIILLALIGTLIFIRFYNSENKALKEFALISLAVAANIKLFPAIFGAILLKERRWKDALKCAAYGIGLFVVPVLVYGICYKLTGNRTIDVTEVFSSLARASSTHATQTWTLEGNSLKATLYKLCRFFIHDIKMTGTLSFVFAICNALCFCLSLFCFFIAKKQYQALMILAYLSIYIPTASFWYFLIFFIPALFTLFNDTEKKSTIDFIQFIFFILVFSYCHSDTKIYILNAHRTWHLFANYLILHFYIIYDYFRNRNLLRNKNYGLSHSNTIK